MQIRHIGLSLGNLEDFVGGLGEVSQLLVQTLADRADELRQQHGIALYVHCVPALQGCFGDTVKYLPVQRSQEWRHSGAPRMDLWHRLNQLNRYPPPDGQGLKLVTVHDLNYLYEKHGLSRWQHGWRMRRQLAGSDAVVTITEHVAGDVRRELGWRGPLRVIHNGVRDLINQPRTPVSALEGQRFFFHISRLTPSKNIPALLGLMAAWPEKQLVLAGPSAEGNAALQAEAARRGLGNVSLLTRPDNAQRAWLYANCEAFLFPSITEGFGLPPIEAMLFGKPVFLSDRTSLPEVGGDAAWYWHDFDPQSMRRAMEHGLARHDAARAQAVRTHAMRFNWQRAAQDYLDVYLSLLDNGRLELAA